ncbi:MAG: ABC transporter permease [Lachnospiraceae bacterium]|nr:ABC transporter permease [Lachnospiraceae bacterium]
MKNMKGLRSVFRFTVKQYMARNGFARLTILLALLLFLGGTALIYFTGKPSAPKDEKEGDKEKETTVCQVNVVNMTGLDINLPEQDDEEEEKKDSAGTVYVYSLSEDDENEAFKKASEQETHIIAVVEKETTGDGIVKYTTRLKVPDGSKISKSEALEAGNVISDAVRLAVYESVHMTEESIQFVSLEATSRSISTDEEISMLNMVIRGFLPAILGLVMYMMILLHGQTICKEVSIEKTSKLMETMLVSVEPNALILGKTVALTVLALGQFFAWVAGGLLGLLAGGILGKALHGSEFHNKLSSVLNFLRNFIGESALSPAAIVMSIIVFCFGIFIYFALAAIGGSFVSKPEETSSASGMFIFPMIIFWMITYFASFSGAQDVIRVCRYIPFAAPFCVPVDVLTGNMGLLGGAIVCLEVTAVALLLIFIAARIYRGMMLHTGQKVSMKRIWEFICGR